MWVRGKTPGLQIAMSLIRQTDRPSVVSNMPEHLLLRRNMYEYGVNRNFNLRPISTVC